jgi:arylsulfatase
MCAAASVQAADKLTHDAEYYILEAQNGEKWAADDKAVEEKLAALREKNGGKPPNIIYILIDDMGFGEIGMPDMSVTRGYKTPNLDAMAKEGLSLQRMYTEPSCTPTRVHDGTPSRSDWRRRSEGDARWRWIACRGGYPRGGAW